MKEFGGKVAVITGGASGIGQAIAERAAREQMKIVLADIEQPALDQTTTMLSEMGASVVGVRTDVSSSEEMEALACQTLAAFGSADLLFNNAGVGGGGGNIWELPLDQWQWVLGVNLLGVIHGIRVFVPRMISQNTECHVVNTASVAGLCCLGASATYTVSKYGVVGISEVLSCELTRARAKVGVSVLCPALVKTRFLDSGRNRPAGCGGPVVSAPLSQADADARWAKSGTKWRHLGPVIEAGDVADITFAAIRDRRFYILPQHQVIDLVQARADDIQSGRAPTTARAS